VRYRLSLMNRWANEGGNPFADAKWDEAWKTSDVDATEWETIRSGLRKEAHLGAIRQIDKDARGPKEGMF